MPMADPERLAATLAAHALHGVECHGGAYDASGAHCACGRWEARFDLSVGEVEAAWARHVAKVIEEDTHDGDGN